MGRSGLAEQGARGRRRPSRPAGTSSTTTALAPSGAPAPTRTGPMTFAPGADAGRRARSSGPGSSPARSPIVTNGAIDDARARSRPGRRSRPARGRGRRPGAITTGSPIATCASTIASRCASRGSTGTPRACSARLEPVEHLGEERVADPGEPQRICERRVEPRAELVALAAVDAAVTRASASTASRSRGWRARIAARTRRRCHAAGYRRPLRSRTCVPASTSASTRRCRRRSRVGAGTRRVRRGHLLRRRAGRSTALELLVDGEPSSRVTAHGMPRLDLLRATRRAGRLPRAASGASLGLGPRAAPRSTSACARGSPTADSRGGARADRRAVADPTPLPGSPAGRDLHGDLRAAARAAPARRSTRSARRRRRDWLCVVTDDCSRTGAVRGAPSGGRATTRASSLVALDRAARLLPQLRAGARRWRPPDARYVALADQDDDWHPDKLATLLARARRRAARLQRRAGRRRATASVVADTYWQRRDEQPHDLLSLLVGQRGHRRRVAVPARRCSTTRCRSRPRQFAHFHDHWLALVRPRARRHPLRRPAALRLRPARRRDARARQRHDDHRACASGSRRAPRRARADPAVADALLRRRLPADAVRHRARAALRRPRMPRGAAARARPVPGRRPLGCDARPRWRCAALRDLRRERPQTLGAEWMLALALVWRRLLAASARDRPQRALRLDAVPPPVLDPRPGARAPGEPELRAMAEKIAPLRLAVRDDAPRRVNLLIPTIDLAHFFGGYIAKFNLARRAGRARAARADRDRRPGRLAARATGERELESLQRAGGRARPRRGGVRPRDARARGQPRRRVRRDDVVDGARRPRTRCRRSRPSASST